MLGLIGLVTAKLQRVSLRTSAPRVLPHALNCQSDARRFNDWLLAPMALRAALGFEDAALVGESKRGSYRLKELARR